MVRYIVLGNYLGYPVQATPGAGDTAFFDTIKTFMTDLTTGQRTWQIYYPSK